MNALEKAIEIAYVEEGANKAANKAYLEFLKANFIVPIEKNPKSEQVEVLFLTENQQVFLPVFTRMEYLDQWAEHIKDDINVLKLSGVDLLKGIGDNVIVLLNPGCQIYKEFNAAEIGRMKNMALKIFNQNS